MNIKPMFIYSNKSRTRLKGCHPLLQEVFNSVIKKVDNTILCGHRTESEQNSLSSKQTKVKFPNSKHNSIPSMAIDVAPYPINWEDRERFALFSGYVLGMANGLGITLRWGGLWSMDGQLNVEQNKFDDLVHFELILKD